MDSHDVSPMFTRHCIPTIAATISDHQMPEQGAQMWLGDQQCNIQTGWRWQNQLKLTLYFLHKVQNNKIGYLASSGVLLCMMGSSLKPLLINLPLLFFLLFLGLCFFLLFLFISDCNRGSRIRGRSLKGTIILTWKRGKELDWYSPNYSVRQGQVDIIYPGLLFFSLISPHLHQSAFLFPLKSFHY